MDELKHFKEPEVQTFTIDQVANGSAQFDRDERVRADQGAGRVRVHAAARRPHEHLGDDEAQSLAKLPPLGPRSLPVEQAPSLLHAVRPDGLRIQSGPAGVSRRRNDLDARRERTRLRRSTASPATRACSACRRCKVPAGKFKALAVQPMLKQPGFPFGSGTRTSWFAPGKGSGEARLQARRRQRLHRPADPLARPCGSGSRRRCSRSCSWRRDAAATRRRPRSGRRSRSTSSAWTPWSSSSALRS